MPEGPDGKTIIIVKKVSGHGGHHGGAWKVAYADFVTAMMALFMVLWLVNSASEPTRERIASYFRRPGIFERGSGTPLELGGAGILPDAFTPPASSNSEFEDQKRIYEVEASGGLKGAGSLAGEESQEEHENQPAPPGAAGIGQGDYSTDLAEKVAKSIESALKQDAQNVAAYIGQIEVRVDNRGLHLEIMDTDKASMFERGQSEIRPEAREELRKISELLTKLPNPVDVEGHTDAVPYNARMKSYFDNWDLSTARANAARRALIDAGLKETQIARVVGYSSRKPRIPSEPLHASNRRISITMRFTEQAASILEGKALTETGPAARDKAKTKAIEGPADQRESPLGSLEKAQEVLKKAETPKGDERLQVQLSTSIPEASPDATSQNTSSTNIQSSEQIWMEKDKIFGNRNPFQQ